LGEDALQKTGILQFFYWSKSARGVWNTPPSPIFGDLIPLDASFEEEFSKKKILPRRQLQIKL
jgi:hypothetical protein